MANNNNTPVCPDWVWLKSSNVHVAKDRGWFKTYTPFTSQIRSSIFCSPNYVPVLGIGTVEIPTKRSPNRSGVSGHGSLHLKQVLHVPEFLCNVIGDSIETSDGYEVQMRYSAATLGTIKDSQGKNVAYFDSNSPLFAIKVRNQPEGPKLGPHTLQKDGTYMLSCYWEHSEQQKWLDYQAGNGVNYSGSVPTRTNGTNPPYTDDEKSFLKSNWGNEYRFLIQHGLKIHKDEDREEGRLILRALMHGDDLDGESAKDEFEEEDEFDFTGHQADYNFSHKQLEWIGTHYGNSEAFMISYGLKWYDDEDVEEAKAIIDTIFIEDHIV